MKEIYFFDSYAIMEISKGNSNYISYINSNVILTKLNLFEIFYSTLSQKGDGEAQKLFEDYKEFIIDFSLNDIKEAAKLRFKFRERKLSMVDCIGYILAKKLGIKFLTGDKEFEDISNVEFVK